MNLDPFVRKTAALAFPLAVLGGSALSACGLTGGVSEVSCTQVAPHKLKVRPGDTYGDIANRVNKRYHTHLDMWELGQKIQDIPGNPAILTAEDKLTIYDPTSCK